MVPTGMKGGLGFLKNKLLPYFNVLGTYLLRLSFSNVSIFLQIWFADKALL